MEELRETGGRVGRDGVEGEKEGKKRNCRRRVNGDQKENRDEGKREKRKRNIIIKVMEVKEGKRRKQ